MAVMRRPINNPVNGLEVARIIDSAADLPKCCNDDTIKSNANTKSTSVPMMYNSVRILFQGFGLGIAGCMGIAGSNSGINFKDTGRAPPADRLNKNLIK